MPVYGTIASQFNDPGTNELYKDLMKVLDEKTKTSFESSINLTLGDSEKIYIIPPKRIRYLSEIADSNRNYDEWVRQAK